MKYTPVLLLFLASVSAWAQNPLIVEQSGDGSSYYYLDKFAFDFEKADYSDIYEIYLTPLDSIHHKDCTEQLIDGKLYIDPDFFATSGKWNDTHYEAPVNGIIGNDFARMEVYIYPQAVQVDPLTFPIMGRRKVKENVGDFTGEIKIKKLYRYLDLNEMFGYDIYDIVAEFQIKEDPTQERSGIMSGTFGANARIDDKVPQKLILDDTFIDADDYENRTYVGAWRSYGDAENKKRVVWGDYRLPFTYNFDYGDGEFMVNEIYMSPEWECYMQGADYETTYFEDGISISRYRNPWW